MKNEKIKKFIVKGFSHGVWCNLGETMAVTESKAISNIKYRLNIRPSGDGLFFGEGVSYSDFKAVLVTV